MFDARGLLDILLGGAGPRGSSQRRPPDPAVFSDMLDQLGTQDTPPTAARRPAPDAGPQQVPGGRWNEPRSPQSPQDIGPPAPTAGTILEDLLRSFLGGAPPQAGTQQQRPGGEGQVPPGGQQGPAMPSEVGRELQDLLRQILQGGRGGATPSAQASRVVGESGAAGGEGPSAAGGLADMLRQVLGQATAGVREGAGKIDEATGLSARAREAIGQATGQSPEALVARLKELIANNKLATGAALGGLGALLLGTGAGRSLAGTAIKVGGLAMIGGLAYKAYQNYEQGRPILSPDQPGGRQALVPAPQGTGFEAGALTDDAARLYIRAMIAAAAADGRIDAAEQERILGGLKQAGLADAGQQFLAAEIGNPASVETLAAATSSPEEAVQVYTAARIAVDPDTGEEHAFLAALAAALGIDRELAAQVDAAARGAA